jgi:hypothetical protein
MADAADGLRRRHGGGAPLAAPALVPADGAPEVAHDYNDDKGAPPVDDAAHHHEHADQEEQEPPSVLRVFAWHNPGTAFLAVAAAWSWALVYVYASSHDRARRIAAAERDGAAAVGPDWDGDVLTSLAAAGPLMAGAVFLMSLEGEAGLTRVLRTQVAAPHNPALWLATLAPWAAHGALWAAWAAATDAPTAAAAGTTASAGSATAAVRDVLLRLAGPPFRKLAAAVAAARTAAPAAAALLPLGASGLLATAAPALLAARLPSAAVAVAGAAFASEVGWRAVLLPHLLRTAPPLRAALVCGCLAAVWALAPAYADAVITPGGRNGLPVAVLNALVQVPLSLVASALYLASRGSVPLTVGFRVAVDAASLVFAGPLAPQRRKGGNDDVDVDGDHGGGVTSADHGEWRRVDAAAALLLAAYVAALPAVAYLWLDGAKRAAARRRRAAAAAVAAASATVVEHHSGAPAESTG